MMDLFLNHFSQNIKIKKTCDNFKKEAKMFEDYIYFFFLIIASIYFF